MIQISVKADVAGAIRALNEIERSIIPKAASAAINKTLANVRTQAVRQVSKATGAKQASIRSRMKLTRARPGQLSGSVELTEKRFPNLASYDARQVRKGVSAKAWGKRKTYRGGFLIQRPWGTIAVTRKAGKRYPLKPLWGPSLVRTMKSPQLERDLNRFARERFLKNFDHEISFRLRRLRGS